MDPSIIFFDIDGTILADDFSVPADAAAAIRATRAKGNLAVINTGRPYTHIDPVVLDIGFDGFVCGCGSFVLLDGTVRFDCTPAPAVCREMVALSRRCGLNAVYELNGGACFDLLDPTEGYFRFMKDYYDRMGLDTTPRQDAPDFRFEKFCAFARPDSDLETFRREASRHFDVIDRGGGMLELVPGQCSKASGLRLVLDTLGIPLERSYAIGDSTNDLPMLTCVPHSIAMGNSPDVLKAQVEYVTRPIREGGLAAALDHYDLL